MATLAKLNSIAASGGDQKAKTEEYKALLAALISAKDTAGLETFVEHIASEQTALVISRGVLQEYAASLKNLEPEQHVRVAQVAIEKIQPRVVAFEDQISTIRENLSAVFEENEQWQEAAKILIGIPLESGQRVLTADYKVGIYVHIAQLFLEDLDYYESEKYLLKAGAILSDTKDRVLTIKHKGSMARIYEYKRRFFDASSRYYDLSFMLQGDEAQTSLESAIICALLAPAGPQRSRQLATLCKDERSPTMTLYPMLQKMFTDRIIRQEEVKTFAASLVGRPGANDSTALEQAIREHNLLAASKVYLNISFEELGVLLDVRASDAEKLASNMISENRLKGHIDQLATLIHFNETDTLQMWDQRIETTCSSVNNIVDRIAFAHPKFAEEASRKHM